MEVTWNYRHKALRAPARRALSLVELTGVAAIVGLVAVAAIGSFGHGTIANGSAAGTARKLSLALAHARRATISTGDNHYVQLSPSTGTITSFTVMRRDTTDIQAEQSFPIAQDVTVTSADRELEFDFDGTALGAYSVSIASPDRSWSVSVVQLTGKVSTTETTP